MAARRGLRGRRLPVQGPSQAGNDGNRRAAEVPAPTGFPRRGRALDVPPDDRRMFASRSRAGVAASRCGGRRRRWRATSGTGRRWPRFVTSPSRRRGHPDRRGNDLPRGLGGRSGSRIQAARSDLSLTRQRLFDLLQRAPAMARSECSRRREILGAAPRGAARYASYAPAHNFDVATNRTRAAVQRINPGRRLPWVVLDLGLAPRGWGATCSSSCCVLRGVVLFRRPFVVPGRYG